MITSSAGLEWLGFVDSKTGTDTNCLSTSSFPVFEMTVLILATVPIVRTCGGKLDGKRHSSRALHWFASNPPANSLTDLQQPYCLTCSPLMVIVSSKPTNTRTTPGSNPPSLVWQGSAIIGSFKLALLKDLANEGADSLTRLFDHA
jgi:hypothetical protein